MNHPALQTIYTKINHHIRVILLLFVLLVLLVTAIFVIKEWQSNQQQQGGVNQLNQSFNYQKNLLDTRQILKRLTFEKKGAALKEDHNALMQQWHSLNGMLIVKSPKFEQWLTDSKRGQKIINRIDQNRLEYQQLKSKTVNLLAAVIDKADQVITKKNRQLNQLYELIVQDNSTDSITISRAKIYTKKLSELSRLTDLHAELTMVQIGFSDLSLNTTPSDFEILNQKIITAYNLHQVLINEDQDSPSLFPITQLMAELELLLGADERTIAKWRGFLRIINDYKIMTIAQLDGIESIISTQKFENLAFVKNYEETTFQLWTDQKLSTFNQLLEVQHQRYILTAVCTLLVLLLMLLLVRLNKHYKNYLNNALEVDEALAKENRASIEVLRKNLAIYKDKMIVGENTITLLKQQVEILETEGKHNLNINSSLANNRLKQLSRMAVKALLSRQSLSRFASYEELIKLHRWIEDKKIIDNLTADKAVELCEVNLGDQVHTAFMNIIAREYRRNNHVILTCDDKLIQQVLIEVEHFQELASLTVALLLKNQKNAQLFFSIDALRSNKEQQTIKILAEVLTKEPVRKLPQHLASLMAEHDSHNLSLEEQDSLHYFQLLFHCHQGDNLITETTKQGFRVSFELPLRIVKGQENKSMFLTNAKVKRQKLTADESINILLICAEPHAQKLIKGYLQKTTAKIQVSKSSDTFIKNLNIESLTKVPIDLVILEASSYRTDYEKLQSHINELPRSVQPPLMVLQSPYQANFEQQGIYAHDNMMLSQSVFLQQITDLMVSKQKSALLIDAEQCHLYQYESTHTDVLLAVNSPIKHQVLMRVLHWLGLQVTVVSHTLMMKKHWQTGRYLILINEFDESPFIELQAGKDNVRGIFLLGKAQKSIKALPAGKHEKFMHWQLANMPAATDVLGLTQLLKPWLIEKHTKVKTDGNKASVSKKRLTAKQGKKSVEANEENPVVITETVKNEQKSIRACFELNQYIKHQGGAELAIFMLDEYVRTINDKTIILISELNANNKAASKALIESLVIQGKIIAANEFVNLLGALDDLLNKNLTPVDASEKIQQFILNIQDEVIAIEQYAESIC